MVAYQRGQLEIQAGGWEKGLREGHCGGQNGFGRDQRRFDLVSQKPSSRYENRKKDVK